MTPVYGKSAYKGHLSGMAINPEKTSLMGFGFRPAPLHVENVIIEPATSAKFLGFIIQNDLGLNQQVKSVSDKIRLAASRIRADGNNFNTRDRRRLYMGWVQGILCSNGCAYLPLLTKSQSQMLQTSCNCAIRSVAKLPRKSYDLSISNVRKHLKILSVDEVAEKLILTHAWKNRSNLKPIEIVGPITRSRSQGNIPQPNQKGMFGKMILTQSKCAFNKLTIEAKSENDPLKAKKIILETIKE